MSKSKNLTDEEVWALAEQIYETELRNEFMPPWVDAPSTYGRGCLNDAAERLGWKPEVCQIDISFKISLIN